MRGHGPGGAFRAGAGVASRSCPPGPISEADGGADSGGYRMWRVRPQTGQVATLLSASTTRKLVQPFVLQ